MKLITKVSEGVYWIEKWIAGLALLILFVSLSLGVVYRYALASPLTWSDEIAMFSLAWLTFIGGSMTIRAKAAPTIDLLTVYLKDSARKVVIVLGYLAALIFVGYLFFLSIQWVTSSNILIQRSSSMQMPMIYAYLCVPVGFLFMFVHSTALIVESLFVEGEVE